MHPAAIKAQLEITGWRQTDIARGLLMSPTSVHDVIHGNRRSQRIENHIAALTGQPLHVLWPQWYGPDGKPIKKRRRHTSTAEILQRLNELQCKEVA